MRVEMRHPAVDVVLLDIARETWIPVRIVCREGPEPQRPQFDSSVIQRSTCALLTGV